MKDDNAGNERRCGYDQIRAPRPFARRNILLCNNFGNTDEHRKAREQGEHFRVPDGRVASLLECRSTHARPDA